MKILTSSVIVVVATVAVVAALFVFVFLVVSSLKNFPSHVGIVENCCFAIYNLADDADNKKKLTALGVKGIVTSVVERNISAISKEWGGNILKFKITT